MKNSTERKIYNERDMDANKIDHPGVAGTGAGVGALTGATVGMAAGGPIGSIIGAVAGGIAVALAAEGVADHFDPKSEDGLLGALNIATVLMQKVMITTVISLPISTARNARTVKIALTITPHVRICRPSGTAGVPMRI